MAVSVFHDAMREARAQRLRRVEVDAVEQERVAREADHESLTQLAADLRLEMAAAKARGEAILQQLAEHAKQIENATAQAQAERKRADEYQAATRSAETAAQTERELRLVAEARPPQVIREPPQVVTVAAPSAPPPASPAAQLPDPPKKLHMRITGRDANGLIAGIEWTPGD